MAGKIKTETAGKPKKPKMRAGASISGACLCGAVEVETEAPVFWAWHDHSAASRRAHGAAYATDVGDSKSLSTAEFKQWVEAKTTAPASAPGQ